MVKQILNYCSNYFLYASYLAALGAAGLGHVSAIILNLDIEYSTLLKTDIFLFAAVLLVYNVDRLTAAGFDHYSSRHYWIRQNRIVLISTALATIPVLLWLSVALPVELVMAALGLGLITFAYNFPVLLKNKRSLKELGILKAFQIALVWALATTLLPALAANELPAINKLLLLATERFCFILPIALISDLRDLRSDNRAMIPTLPLKFGWKLTIYLCTLFCSLFLVLTLVNYWRDFIPLALPHLLSGLYLLLLILLWAKRRREFYYSGMIDGAVFLQALLVFLFYIAY